MSQRPASGMFPARRLRTNGCSYDSSLFPVRRPGYGYANGQRDPHWVQRPGGRLGQAPPATLRLGILQIPAAGPRTVTRLERLLAEFRFRSIGETIVEL